MSLRWQLQMLKLMMGKVLTYSVLVLMLAMSMVNKRWLSGLLLILRQPVYITTC